MDKHYAVKGNKQIEITTDAQRQALVSDGYDIIDETGKIVERSKSSKISVAQYDMLKAESDSLKLEYEALKAELENLKLENTALKAENDSKNTGKK